MIDPKTPLEVLIAAACANVDAWKLSVETEMYPGRQSSNLHIRSKCDAEHYKAKAAAKEACALLCDAVDTYRASKVERTAPIQGDRTAQGKKDPDGTITWKEHLLVHEKYAKKYGTSQSAERIAERGGFGFREATELLGEPLKTFRPR